MSYQVKNTIIGILFIAVSLFLLVYVIVSEIDQSTHLLLFSIIQGCNLLILAVLAIYTENIKRILYTRCDPDRYLSVMIKNYPKKHGKYPGYDIALKIVQGLCAAGRFEEALDELNKTDDFPASIFNESRKKFYYEYLVLIHTSLNNIAEAETALEALKQIAYYKDLSIARQKRIKKQYEDSAMLLGVAKGEFTGAEEYFTDKFKAAKNNFTRVTAKYYLGIIYSHFGDEAKASEAFEYAAANGSKLYVASLARGNRDYV